VFEEPAGDLEPVVSGLAEDVQAYGLAFSPKDYQAGWDEFFPLAADHASIVTWAGDWDGLSADDGPAAVIHQQAQDAGLDMMAVVGPFADGYAVRPVAEASDTYVDKARAFAETFRPRYITLGVEVDIAAVRDTVEFDAYVDVFARSADAVHAV
jgi:hypothetical protein